MSDKYLAALQSLLPSGPAFTRDTDASLTKLLKGLGTELGRVEGRGVDLIDEVDPRTASELLGDFERVYGIAIDESLTDAARQAAILAKIAEQEVLTEAVLLSEVAALINTTYIAQFGGTFLTLEGAIDQYILNGVSSGTTPGNITSIVITHGEAFEASLGAVGDGVGDEAWESFCYVDINHSGSGLTNFVRFTFNNLMTLETSDDFDPSGLLRVAQGAIVPLQVYHSLLSRMQAHERYRIRFIDSAGDIAYF